MRFHALAKRMNTLQLFQAHALVKVVKYSKPSFSERKEAHARAKNIAGFLFIDWLQMNGLNS